MQTRHRIPTIFNLSMVDVLCCALGCVILLWLLNLREAKERAVTAGQASEQLQATQSRLTQTASLLEGVRTERDQSSRELRATQVRLADLDKELAALREKNSAALERLAKLAQDQRALAKEKEDVAKRLATLETQLGEKTAEAATSVRRADDLAGRLQDADVRAKQLQTEIQAYRSKLTTAETKALELTAEASTQKKELALAGRNIDTLQREKKTLADQANRALAAVENRFEGIRLTGKRVLFLVDMSGSMELVDERTPDANKWIGVRETLAKVMRSLTDLEKFQVMLFSDKVSYLLGNEGRWLDYEPKASVDRVLAALAAIKPRGSTNMYDVFEAAFRLRAFGLDTIYVFSDGLPNTGPGLTLEQTRTLKETEQSELLARYIRNRLRRDWNREIAGQPRVRINTIGFFYESPDVGAFLWALARENDGSFVGMSKP